MSRTGIAFLVPWFSGLIASDIDMSWMGILAVLAILVVSQVIYNAILGSGQGDLT